MDFKNLLSKYLFDDQINRFYAFNLMDHDGFTNRTPVHLDHFNKSMCGIYMGYTDQFNMYVEIKLLHIKWNNSIPSGSTSDIFKF